MINIKSIFIRFILYYHNIYVYFWGMLFNKINTLKFIYYIKDNNIKNITANYYFDVGLDKYQNGIYYAKIYTIDQTHHIAFSGNINEINNICNKSYCGIIKRKNIILLNKNNPINIDLKLLDNYRLHSQNYNNPIKNMGMILKIIGIEASHIMIMQLKPFLKTIISIDDIDIDYLYY